MSARPKPRPAEERLRRLLVMLPWLMERGEVTVAEAAERFDLTEAEVVRDLELAAMCGLPPFVDELIDVFVDDGVIVVGVPRLFTRPLRLNSVEAFELLAAGRAAMELPGADATGALGRGLAKLATALGEDDTTGVRIELDRPEMADRLAAAATSSEELLIEYWSASRDATTERRIVPRQVFADRGEWYVSADDDRSGEVRTFRIDRILQVQADRIGGRAERGPVADSRRLVRRRVGPPRVGATVAGGALGGRALPGRRGERPRRRGVDHRAAARGERAVAGADAAAPRAGGRVARPRRVA